MRNTHSPTSFKLAAALLLLGAAGCPVTNPSKDEGVDGGTTTGSSSAQSGNSSSRALSSSGSSSAGLSSSRAQSSSGAQISSSMAMGSSGTGSSAGGGSSMGGGSSSASMGTGSSAAALAPTILSVAPVDGSTGVLVSGSVSARFSEAMDPATLNPPTFTLMAGSTSVAGTVVYSNRTLAFIPSANLVSNTLYTATITVAARSAAGLALASNQSWTFTTAYSVPTVLSTTPLNGSAGVLQTGNVTARFSEPMEAASFTNSTFTLTVAPGATPVPGMVTYLNDTATFSPQANLAENSVFTATVTRGVRSAAGVTLAADRVWTFSTGQAGPVVLPVELGTAENFVILAKAAISTVPPSDIRGNIGVSPSAATFITGFSLTADATNTFSMSTQVVGNVYAADDAPPTPSSLTTAVGDMELAFTDAAGRAASVTELGAGDIGGRTLTPGVYKWGTGVLIPDNVTLSGSANDIWIFQIAQDLTVANGKSVTLMGGARPENVFWQVSGAVQLGTTAHMEGIILSQTAISLATGATVNGRLLAQTAVTLDNNAVTAP